MKAKRSAIPSLAISSLAEAFDLVGADRLPPAGARERRERLVDAGIKPGAIGDMGVVMLEIIGEQRLERLRIEGPARGGEAALDQRPGAGPNQRTGAFDLATARGLLVPNSQLSVATRSSAVSASVPSRS